jgi:hypothetical protein
MPQDTQPSELRVSRVIDFKIPLWSILSAAFFLALLIGGMYFQLNRLSEDMTELKIAVKAGNTSQASVQGELAILRFRVETLEADKRALNGGTR